MLLALSLPIFISAKEDLHDRFVLVDFGQQNKLKSSLPTTEGDNGTIVAGCVNIISGQYIDSTIDLSLESLEPLAVNRNYSSRTDGTYYTAPPVEGGPNAYQWFINSNTLLLIDTKKGTWAGLGEIGGGNFSYHCKGKSPHYEFDFFSNKGVTNSGSGLLTGQTNFKNSTIDFNRGNGFYEAHSGDGNCRYYKATSFSPHYTDLGVNFLQWEKKPSGNLITYEYNKEGRLIECKSIASHSKKVFSKLRYLWGEGNGFTIMGDEGRLVHYDVKKIQTKGRAPGWVIDKVHYPNGLEVKYFYNQGEENPYFCTGKELANRCIQRVEYYHSGLNKVGDRDIWLSRDDFRIHKVKLLESTIGTSPELHITHRFFYHKNSTEVFDAQNCLTRFIYDDEKRITEIEKFHNNGNRFSVEKNIWGTGANYGNLMAKVLEDGQKNPYFARLFEYDERGNVVTEKLLGNLSGESTQTIQYNADGTISEKGIEAYIKWYTYSQDGFNLLKTERDGNKFIHYGYVQGTNLLSCKLIDDTQKIRGREFRFYNEDSALIKKVEDDGSSTELDNLIDVTERRITYFHPRKENPGLGLPEIVEEGYLDLKSGEEKILKTYVNHYNGLGKIDEQIVYDVHGKLAFREINTYDIMGRIIEEIDSLNQKTTYTYDLNGNLIKKNGAFETNYIYDFANRLINEIVIDPSGEKRIRRFAYDLMGNQILEQDHLGNETHYIYDEFQRLIKINLPPILNEKGERVSNTIFKGYDVANHLISEIDADGEKKQTRYNIRGQPVEHSYLGQNSDQMIYDLQGNLVKTISKKGAITKYKYDYLKRLTEKILISPDGKIVGSEKFEYDAFHLRKKIDLNGLVHSFFYDGAGRESIILSGNRKITKEYDSLGRVSSIHEWIDDEVKITRRYSYDLKDRLAEEIVENQKGIESRVGYIYDTYGNLSQEIHYPENQPAIITTIYDAFKRPRMVLDPLGHQTRYFYEQIINNDNQRVDEVTIINAEGGATIQRLNTLGLIEESIQKNPLGEVIAKERTIYNGKGRKICEFISVFKEDSEQEIINKFTYSFDKLVEQVEEDEKHTRYVYDLNGDLIEKSSPFSKIIFHYDAFGRMTEQLAFSTNDKDDKSIFEYDVLGQIVKVIHNGIQTLRTYNLFGEIESETQESGLTIEYSYDGLGRRTCLKLPDGSLITYTYLGSRLHKVTRVNKQQEPIYSHIYLSFDWSGNVKESIALTGQTQSFFYDLLERKIAIKNDEWKETGITYDSLGNVIKVVIQDSAGKINSHFSYNALSQLIQETGFSVNTYKYDSIHNRVGKNLKAYQVGTCNKLLSTGDEQLVWDDEGNLQRRNGPQDVYLSYDSLSRLNLYQIDGISYSYSYDSFNRRISKSVEGYSPIFYLYDGENEIGLTDENGNILELRVLGLGKGAEIGAAIAIELDDNVYLPIHNHSGSVCCLLNKAGKVVESYRYSAFGEVSILDPQGNSLEVSQVENTWLFFSKRQDMESNLFYFGRRYYDAKLGRWITPDPKGFHDDSNLYTFVKNNPVTLFDLYGLKAESNKEEISGRSFLFSIWERLVGAVRGAGSVVEWVGKNLIPVPGIRDGVEAIGRWTAGGRLFQRAEYHSCNSKILHIPGKRNNTTDSVYMNGIYNTQEEALLGGKNLSLSNNDCELYVAYNSSHGLVTDFIECFFAMIGMPSSPERILLEFIKERPDRKIEIFAHSQAGLHVNNLCRYLRDDELNRISVRTFGSAKLIANGAYADVTNVVSFADVVPLFSIFSYVFSLLGIQKNTTFVPPIHYNPIKEHSFLEKTYFNRAINELTRTKNL